MSFLIHGWPHGSTHNPVYHNIITFFFHVSYCLLQCLSSERRQNETGLVDICVVVLVDGIFLLWCPASEWGLDVAGGILAADHEANLAGWVGWDSGVSVFNNWEDFLAVFLQLGDQWQVEPLVLSCRNMLAYSLGCKMRLSKNYSTDPPRTPNL